MQGAQHAMGRPSRANDGTHEHFADTFSRIVQRICAWSQGSWTAPERSQLPLRLLLPSALLHLPLESEIQVDHGELCTKAQDEATEFSNAMQHIKMVHLQPGRARPCLCEGSFVVWLVGRSCPVARSKTCGGSSSRRALTQICNT